MIIDVVMPGLDGIELAARVWEECPDKRVLFMSGHAAEVLAQHGLAYLDIPFLAKPFTRDEALAKVREALERRHGSRTDARQRSQFPAPPKLGGSESSTS